jgi:monoamine oxidase
MEYDCLILGAGLSGLYAALQLQQRGLRCAVLEARDRPGGRILAVSPDGVTRFDLGPAWLWPEFQPLIADLTQTLGVELFAQQTFGAALYEDPNQPAPLRIDGESPNAHSWRITGGTTGLIEALAERLAPETIRTGRRVVELHQQPDGTEVHTVDGDGREECFRAPRIVSTIPLRLLAESVRFAPALSAEYSRTFAATPTWMAAHAKFLAFYDVPFWREAGLSGEVFSRRGPLTEIYDASPAQGGPYALFGFFGLPAQARRQLGREELAARSLAQLQRLFGDAALTPSGWEIKDWSEDPLTATAADAVPPAGHPAYGLPETLRTAWDGRLLFAGSEASAGHGGYLEGALETAATACALIGPNNTDQNRK